MPILRQIISPDYAFHCPACGHGHCFWVHEPPPGPRWTFNGNMDRPTFEPSLKNDDGQGNICHLNITNGMIIYHPDCTHKLAGQTIPMQDMDHA